MCLGGWVFRFSFWVFFVRDLDCVAGFVVVKVLLIGLRCWF